jgi:hypothetical protein
MAKPRLSDEAKARIRAEEEARRRAELEERYRREVRAELEADLAAEEATTDVDRRPVAPRSTAPREVPPPAGRGEHVRILPKVDPAAARRAADVVASPLVAPELVAVPVEMARVPRSRLWWLGAAMLVTGATALVAGVLISRDSPGDDDSTTALELDGDGELDASEAVADDAAELAGEAWVLGADGGIVVTPRAPLMSLDALRRELAEPAGEPRWPIPQNPPLDELLRERSPPEPPERATP